MEQVLTCSFPLTRSQRSGAVPNRCHRLRNHPVACTEVEHYTGRVKENRKTIRTPVALVVLDGWGLSDHTTHNAIHAAETPMFDLLWNRCAHARFDASGAAVGLPDGQMGNSEIGHMAIGAGTPIDTDLVRINKAIARGALALDPTLLGMWSHLREHASTLHLMGLLSPGGIHSHSDHLYALLREAERAGVSRVVIHAFLDGRDCAPQSAAHYLDELELFLSGGERGFIASVSGRYYAMDRDKNFDRLARVEQVLYDGSAERVFQRVSPSTAVRQQYAADVFDEHIEPMLFLDRTGTPRTIEHGDAVCFFNFRADRARMLARSVADRTDDLDLFFTTMTEYDATIPAHVIFPPFRPEETLAGTISRAGLRQVHIAETEKYAHATYFLNGGRETPHHGEEHILIESRKDVRTHDEAPEMRASEIADAAVASLESGTDFLFINFANADMVGHTANVPALHKALSAVDTALGRVIDTVRKRGGFALITADHGNAERNFDVETNSKHTAHTTNLVPCILTEEGYTLADGALPDIAPTILSIMGLPVPPTMNGIVRARRIERP